MADAILLVLAVCIDAFAVSVAYGAQSIRIPLKSVCIIAGFGTFFLGISLYLAVLLQQFFPLYVCRYISFAVLLALGIISLFQTQMKRYVKKHKEGKLVFSWQEISFVIDVYIDETKADIDHSKELNAKEAVYLAVALSIDSLATGIAFGMAVQNPLDVLLISLLMGILIIVIGQWIGKRISKAVHMDLSWISGLILIILAFSRLW
ncbi:MAG: sporulation membrane protein YtaF [Erysipelotrichaceae bacterium]|jgi:putative sporulation protein YtaF|nr:sporulation membrane protein YtaF [Erysipelotrichaceae bacterium]